jgi:uncharacterized protein (DUF1810 family)
MSRQIAYAGAVSTQGEGLERFTEAQERVYEVALGELRKGRKESHWMWFVFPQLRGLGRSPTSERYGISSLDEARAYLRHDALGPRLLECTRAVVRSQAPTARELFGHPDDLKFRSSMTLFHAADPTVPEFAAALDKYFAGEPDPLTMELLAAQGE